MITSIDKEKAFDKIKAGIDKDTPKPGRVGGIPIANTVKLIAILRK